MVVHLVKFTFKRPGWNFLFEADWCRSTFLDRLARQTCWMMSS